MNGENQPVTAGPGNRWGTRFRHGHKWAGLVAGLFLLVTGASGIVLNYRQPIFSALGMETGRNRERDASPLPVSISTHEPCLTTSECVADGAVDFAGALALARTEWGDVPLDRIEIRAGGGTVTFRFRNEAGAELWVDAADGRHLVKGAYERISKPDRNGQVTRTTDWGKVLIDLHTGRIGGSLGKAIISTVAALLLFLSASGFYLWLKPLLKWRRNNKAVVPH